MRRVLEYTARFDGLQAASVAELEIPRRRAAPPPSTRCPPAQREALRAGGRAHPQLPRAPARGLRALAGATAMPTAALLGQKVTPLDRVGIYVPGGKAAYPSTC